MAEVEIVVLERAAVKLAPEAQWFESISFLRLQFAL
jgi:hypothetical protein